MKYLLLLVFMGLLSQSYSQEKNSESVSKLVNNERFQAFAKNFIVDAYNFVSYHNVKAIRSNPEQFTNAFKEVNEKTSDEDLTRIFSAYSLDYEKVIALKNKIDNDLFNLLRDVPELQNYDEATFQGLIMEGLDQGMNSIDDDWGDIRDGISTNLAKGLTLSEVWDCIKKGLGLGGGSILTIAGLNKVMHEGVQEVVILVSKWLAKRVGWIGLIATVLEITECIWEEAND